MEGFKLTKKKKTYSNKINPKAQEESTVQANQLPGTNSKYTPSSANLKDEKKSGK